MYGKIAALPVTGMGAAVAGPVSVLGFLLIGLTLVFAGPRLWGCCQNCTAATDQPTQHEGGRVS